MRTRDFSFELPQELIAQFPADRRDASRLMCLDRRTGAVRHSAMTELPDLLPAGALLVVNDSRVRKARLFGSVIRDPAVAVSRAVPAETPAVRGKRSHAERFGEMKTGAPREFLFLRRTEASDMRPAEGHVDGSRRATGEPADSAGETWMVMTRRPGRLKPGTCVIFPGDLCGTVHGHSGQFTFLHFESRLAESYFDAHGHVPLPPYIQRDDGELDAERYQTVYAANPGSVAAPTAGLHLTNSLLDAITDRGMTIARVTLHVGLGTFLPVRTELVRDHRMHSEEFEVSEDTRRVVTDAQRDGRPVVAVGTTSVRTLESAYDPETGGVRAGRGSTNLFITPGYRFNVVTAMLTNFHTPESTLLMLVCAFAGTQQVLSAYREAVKERYRFFSYGDGMLIQ